MGKTMIDWIHESNLNSAIFHVFTMLWIQQEFKSFLGFDGDGWSHGKIIGLMPQLWWIWDISWRWEKSNPKMVGSSGISFYSDRDIKRKSEPFGKTWLWLDMLFGWKAISLIFIGGYNRKSKGLWETSPFSDDFLEDIRYFLQRAPIMGESQQ